MTERRSNSLDRSAVEQLLAEAERRIAQGEQQIAAQRSLIADLNRQGDAGAVSHAKYLLAGLELLQSARRASRERLVSQLNGTT